MHTGSSRTALSHTDINWLTPTRSASYPLSASAACFVVNYLTQDLYFYENGTTIEDGWGALRIFGVTEGNMLKYPINKREPLRLELAALADAVLEKRAAPVTGEDGLKALRLAIGSVALGANWDRQLP